ncbi:type II toxin-antitoxin system VapC family toxin [Spirosoma rhododendri]|uniref:Type II toxin-antitoxin system VapC family toxin n=1 Tax=Spirosoma rhododendri TaxID=2728024 RepID=A0A7L5DLK0_9BACT|nr:type II toxin-antitoxin system VapC family toxin [Spirosoma rhododendri]QJD78975.1 type II toxin-antitoxin system VapC family toxin [Spirosoma rhododendri]
MRVLLDTQSLIWSLENADLLTTTAKNAIREAEGVFVTPISFYELAIKLKIGKDIGSLRPINEIITETLLSGFQWLTLTRQQIEAYQMIPLHEPHRDPFDRLILAIAYAEQMSIVSSDHRFKLYSELIDIIW